ncbi:MAG: NAD-dependent succinate-semialdehyde dehydrogenase [Sulfuricaulis sp.]|uniref:NAD-dependent succinate-semialdehyde dehydrogenase n=1 Tax=Sulfuricaulis sp. TaxID=2003553 RepID=UPI0025EA1CE6|nr:NAD-dependent succinate-semialdehyde dehydrogenase [Sulfuricaulis sp.]MCR4346371.1 NAD-dependent succinate-semialdehyde dehydrogenase [Sulfuricaulis sp.]
METINPTTGERLKSFDTWSEQRVEAALASAATANPGWQATSFAERARLFHSVAAELRNNSAHYAGIITLEMGKVVREARAEVEKCAWGCEFYAEHAEAFLRQEIIQTDASSSYVSYPPLGTVLAIMPWNFPFWQVFRFAAPSLMAGNTALLKHASNVPQCALAIEEIFHKAGCPKGVFQTLMISAAQAEKIIADPRIHAVTLTGSEAAGRKVASAAGAALKKTVLELGGSDAFIVLADADLEQAADVGIASRFLNCGQSCIAAKRFILVESIAETFIEKLKHKTHSLRMDDPVREDTQIGPMARADLRDQLHKQVTDSVTAGATFALHGGPAAGPGFFYEPTIIDHVRPGMRAYEEELFGPVAVVIRAKNEEDAVRIANDSRYGLGASVFTRDVKKGERLARHIQSGSSFVNGMVKSDPRLPFGGVKASGYGRELSVHGMREFVNVKTVWIR